MNTENTGISSTLASLKEPKAESHANVDNNKEEQQLQDDNINIDNNNEIDDGPHAKRTKLSEDKIIVSSTNSPSPVPQSLTSESRSDVAAQLNELMQQGTETQTVIENNTIVGNKLNGSTTEMSATNSPRQTATDIVRKSGRNVEDIIDGSDLRKFLHKSLTEYMVKGLDEIVSLWEKGEFDTDLQSVDNDDNFETRDELKKKVVLKFADILKSLTEK